MSNVAGARFELLDFFIVDVVSNAFEAGICEGANQGKSDVAEPDDADLGGTVIDFAGEFGGKGVRSGRRSGMAVGAVHETDSRRQVLNSGRVFDEMSDGG